MARSKATDSSSTDNSATSTAPTVEAGEFAADREKEEVVIVLAVLDEQAEEVTIPALAGRTVADCRSNSNYPDDDPVVEVLYVSSINYRLSEQRDMTWTPGKILGMYQGNNLSGYNLRSYSLPLSRLREIDT